MCLKRAIIGCLIKTLWQINFNQNLPGLLGGDELEEEQSTNCERHWAGGAGAGGAGGAGGGGGVQPESETPVENVQAQVPQQSCKFLYI